MFPLPVLTHRSGAWPWVLRDHAVRRLEKEPPLPGGTPGVRPGRCAPRVPALTRVVGQQHQKTWATGTEEDGSVTHKVGSGWARIVSRDNMEGAGCTASWLPRVLGVGEDLTRSTSTVPVGVHTRSHQTSRLFRRLGCPPPPRKPEHTHQEAPAGPCSSENLD